MMPGHSQSQGENAFFSTTGARYVHSDAFLIICQVLCGKLIVAAATLSEAFWYHDSIVYVLDVRTQNGDEPVGEITFFLGAKLPF